MILECRHVVTIVDDGTVGRFGSDRCGRIQSGSFLVFLGVLDTIKNVRLVEVLVLHLVVEYPTWRIGSSKVDVGDTRLSLEARE